MIEDIELPHLPECLLGLPLEIIHEIHSHTYHAIKADRQQSGEPVAWQLRLPDGRVKLEKEYPAWADGGDGYSIKPLYATPQPAESHIERANRIVDSWPEWKRNYAITKHDVKLTQPTTPAQEPACKTCGGSKVDPGGLPICRTCGQQHTTPAQEPSVPEGWKLVPIKPTHVMVQVGKHAAPYRATDVYRAMLATAPKFGEEQ